MKGSSGDVICKPKHGGTVPPATSLFAIIAACPHTSGPCPKPKRLQPYAEILSYGKNSPPKHPSTPQDSLSLVCRLVLTTEGAPWRSSGRAKDCFPLEAAVSNMHRTLARDCDWDQDSHLSQLFSAYLLAIRFFFCAVRRMLELLLPKAVHSAPKLHLRLMWH